MFSKFQKSNCLKMLEAKKIDIYLLQQPSQSHLTDGISPITKDKKSYGWKIRRSPHQPYIDKEKLSY